MVNVERDKSMERGHWRVMPVNPEGKTIIVTAEMLVMAINSLLLSGLERIPDNPPEYSFTNSLDLTFSTNI